MTGKKEKNKKEKQVIRVNKLGLALVSSIFFFVLYLSGAVYAQNIYTLQYSPYSNPQYNYNYNSQAQYQPNNFGSSNYQSNSLNYGYQYYEPNFQSQYSRLGVSYTDFWPILGNSDKCEAGNDFIVSIRPGSCMPAVVRSDLLEEQNVPVFCTLDAVKLNPLIDVSQIKGVTFKGNLPKGVAGISFHPSQAALRAYSAKLDAPLLNDVGYVVISLKREQAEKNMPDWIGGNLTAVLRYDILGAFGTERPQLILPSMSEDEWHEEFRNYGFWKGKAYARLDWISGNTANIALYSDENNIIRKLSLANGQTSELIYMPGFYCKAGVRIRVNSLDVPARKIKIQVDNEELWLREGEYFREGLCRVNTIEKPEAGGNVGIRCGSKSFNLKLGIYENMEFLESGNKISKKIGEKLVEPWYIAYSGVAPESISSGERRFIVLVNIQDADSKYLDLGAIKESYLENLKRRISSASLYSSRDKKQYADNIAKQVSSYFGKSNSNVKIVWYGEGVNDYTFEGAGGRLDTSYSGENQKIEEYFGKARETARDISSLYGNEKTGTGEDYGPKALSEAAELAKKIGKTETQKEIYEELQRDYPDSHYSRDAGAGLNSMENYNDEKAGGTLDLGYDSVYLRLIEIKEPSEMDASVLFETEAGERRVMKGEYIVEDGEGFNYEIIDANSNNIEIDNKDNRVIVNLNGERYSLYSTFLYWWDKTKNDWVSVDDEIANGLFYKNLKLELAKLKNQDISFLKKVTINGKDYSLEKSKDATITRSNDNKELIIRFTDDKLGAYLLSNDILQKETIKDSKKFTSLETEITNAEWKDKLKTELRNYKDSRQTTSMTSTTSNRESLKLIDFNEESAYVDANYKDIDGYWRHEYKTILLGDREILGNFNIKVKEINLKREASISVLPEMPNEYAEANFSFMIGIEKRAIQLSPEKTSELIQKLNKTIEKWQKIVNKLGEVVKVWKGACFATSALLTVKNLFENLGGKSMARQEVMRNSGGWQEKCNKMVGEGQYPTLDACFYANRDKINGAVSEREAEYQKTNNEIQQASSGHTKSDGLFGKNTDTRAAGRDYMKNTFIPYCTSPSNRDKVIKLSDNSEMKLGEICKDSASVEKMYDSGDLTWNEMRDIVTNSRLLEKENSKEIANNQLAGTLQPLRDRKERTESESAVNKVLGREVNFRIPTDARRAAASAEIQNINSGDAGKLNIEEGKYIFQTIPFVPEDKKNQQKYDAVSQKSFAIKVEKTQNGVYNIEKAYVLGKDGKATTEKYVDDSDGLKQLKTYFANQEKVSYFTESMPEICHNTYKNYKVKYFESEPYRGLPAVVPVDIKDGWYAGTKPILSPVFGQKPYTAAGQLSSFWLCNVGKNGIEEFDSSISDDSPCIQINLDTGQATDQISCLTREAATKLVSRARNLVREASQQYGKGKTITLSGIGNVQVGNPAGASQGTSCQDFMSPEDCYLMFNTCDPVICPSSRCNLGGAYPVDDVIQTGIAGSVFLCLPNAREGIFVPVCLSGIQAGLDSYLSILKSFRDCLQENLDSGKTVGVCDEIFSIYMCEFFWRQLAPMMDIIIPKMIESAYGQGTRGGGEYATVQNAWDNMQKSTSYFKDYYAVNAFNAFKARSTSEAGGEVCKMFIGSKFPTSKNLIDNLLEPESPVQFYAWFDEIPYTDATVPATSQYKVYYHIYGGKDIGHYFSVYLRNPPASGYYASQQQIVIDTGYAGISQSVDKTKDFTAPAGYKELCVRIDTKEECGFKQVSTDFALNYIKDKYAQEQAGQEVTSEKECVSGAPSLTPIAQPNVQEGVSQAVMPQIYNRGIVRVCSSDNPGARTNPERWKSVGDCDKAKGISCWVDQDSVKGAIRNQEIENQTLDSIGDISGRLQAEGVLDYQQSFSEIGRMTDRQQEILGHMKSGSIDEDEIKYFARDADSLEQMVFGNELKARVVYMKFEVYVKAAEYFYLKSFGGVESFAVKKEDVEKENKEGEKKVEKENTETENIIGGCSINPKLKFEDNKAKLSVAGSNCENIVFSAVLMKKESLGFDIFQKDSEVNGGAIFNLVINNNLAIGEVSSADLEDGTYYYKLSWTENKLVKEEKSEDVIYTKPVVETTEAATPAPPAEENKCDFAGDINIEQKPDRDKNLINIIASIIGNENCEGKEVTFTMKKSTISILTSKKVTFSDNTAEYDFEYKSPGIYTFTAFCEGCTKKERTEAISAEIVT